jgi:TIGR00701 family protein
MAGLLYLPRIFVYHSDVKDNQIQKETFKTMERRLFFYIMNPAMILSWIFGLLLIHSTGLESFSSLWLQIKLAAVTLLSIYHFFLLSCLRKFDIDKNGYSSRFYRIINEIPTILLIIIVFVVIFKPL